MVFNFEEVFGRKSEAEMALERQSKDFVQLYMEKFQMWETTQISYGSTWFCHTWELCNENYEEGLEWIMSRLVYVFH